MKKIPFFLALCLAFVGCASPNLLSTKEAYATAPVVENTYYVTSPKVILAGNSKSIVFSLQRTVVAASKNITFTLSYVNPSDGLLINIDRYESFEPGEKSKPIRLTVPAGANVNLLLYEQDHTGTYRCKNIDGKTIVRLI
jgi:hypothetical protein